MLRESLLRVMDEYAKARQEPYKNHPLAIFIRRDIPEVCKRYFPNYPDLIWRGSSGITQWADAPWIAAFDPVVTKSAQEGYYPVYLFTSSMDAVFLSLNQGMTKIKEEHGTKRGREILENHASLLRKRLDPQYLENFNENPIDLQPHKIGSRLELYQPGHAFGKRYDLDKLPKTEILVRDLDNMLELYYRATFSGGVEELDAGDLISSPDQPIPTLTEKKRYSYHRKVDRNPYLAAKAKKIHGYTCKVCHFNFEEIYGELGKEYIEAHHLTPLAQIPENLSVQLSPKDDFTVVCANCHRMIHKKGAPQTFGEFLQYYRQQ